MIMMASPKPKGISVKSLESSVLTEEATDTGVSVRCQVNVGIQEVQWIAQNEVSIQLATGIIARDGINYIPLDSKTSVQPREITETQAATPGVISNRSAIMIKRCIICPKGSQIPLVSSVVGGWRWWWRCNDFL